MKFLFNHLKFVVEFLLSVLMTQLNCFCWDQPRSCTHLRNQAVYKRPNAPLVRMTKQTRNVKTLNQPPSNWWVQYILGWVVLVSFAKICFDPWSLAKILHSSYLDVDAHLYGNQTTRLTLAMEYQIGIERVSVTPYFQLEKIIEESRKTATKKLYTMLCSRHIELLMRAKSKPFMNK